MKSSYLLLAMIATGCAQPLPAVAVKCDDTDQMCNTPSCSQDVNDALVWVECRNFTKPTRLSYYYLGSQLIASRKLSIGQDHIGYAAFQKEDRKKLRVCGENLKDCVLLIESQ